VPDRTPVGALVNNVDLVIVRFDDNHSVLYGRCLHRGALMLDGSVSGDNLICGLHGWDYLFHTGVSSYNNAEQLAKFSSWLEGDDLCVDQDEIETWEKAHPQPYDRAAYQGAYQDPHGDSVEPHVGLIRRLANEGLEYLGHHGPVTSMGVSREQLPKWDDIQFVTAQLARKPQLDEVAVVTEVVIGPNADKPLRLDIPLFVSDMSYGALSEELARGAELAGTGGHLPGAKVQGKIADVRGLTPGTDAISPSTFQDLENEDDFRRLADQVRAASGGVPIGVKLSAQHIEDDIDAALRVGVDYIILDGRGGGTGAAPVVFRDHISVPTIPALARARRHLDAPGRRDSTLVITGGLRTHTDFAKALALGADAVAVFNSAMQAIGCIGMRACSSNNCPVGIATQKPELRARLPVDDAAHRLHKFFAVTAELMTVLARACGHTHLREFCTDDLTTFGREMAHLTDIAYGGVSR
jgi:nitrite reductase/ring-hydroxylating ferredoxin subunit